MDREKKIKYFLKIIQVPLLPRQMHESLMTLHETLMQTCLNRDFPVEEINRLKSEMDLEKGTSH